MPKVRQQEVSGVPDVGMLSDDLKSHSTSLVLKVWTRAEAESHPLHGKAMGAAGVYAYIVCR